MIERQKIRILAAIMFADLVGYTSLMQEDEENAKNIRDRHRKVLEDLVLEYKGNIIQYYGDGTLSVFGSIVEAVRCAIRIQQELQKPPKIGLKIGIHLGDIVYDDDGIYGDGVNITARIQSFASSGSILISEKVHDELRNQPDISCVLLGDFRLKNVNRPISIWAVSANGITVPSHKDLEKLDCFNKRSIAVLPFVNMSGDKQNEYFSDGITEEIINALTKIEGLNITSRTSSFAFKNKDTDIKTIASKLNVVYILEGSVRKSGQRVRITAQLIDTQNDFHIWSEIYDRNLEDIFQVQDEIANEISLRLIKEFEDIDTKKARSLSPAQNVEAYNLVLKGLFYWNKWNPDDCYKAIALFEEAIKLENNYALAYAGLSSCYIFLGGYGLLSSQESNLKSMEYSNKALMYDPNLPQAIVSLAMSYLFFEWNWKEAQKYFLKAIAISPGYAHAHYTYSIYLLIMGRIKEAISECETAARLDPLSLVINSALGDVYQCAGLLDQAILQFEKVLELDKYFTHAKWNLAFSYLLKCDYEKGIYLLEEAFNETPSKTKWLAPVGYAYSLIGKSDLTNQYFKEVEMLSKNSELSLNLDLAILSLGLNDLDKAVFYVEKAIENRETGMVFLKASPFFRVLLKDGKIDHLLKQLNLE